MGDLTMDFLRLMLMAAMLLTSLQGQAAESVSAPVPATHEVEFLRNPDKACTDCHKEQSEGMHGKHGQATNPNNLKPVTCTNCHGQPSPQHREGVKDVMRFSHSLKDKESIKLYPISEQNGVCMSCHEPKSLREGSGPTMCTLPSSPAPAATSCIRSRSPWWGYRRSPASSSASTATASSMRPARPGRSSPNRLPARRHHELLSP